ncbi:unnamed protein product [Darwinula stevensoni]|uniref:Uncharacterized protein n=1 Tax=Darwinula stevensoni TaxID=69355 RepID=A0A7R8XGL1_9CRUS|nr:unnamed protein product [Darwinula stevensoni]CAG0892637.1 unnamed protein product [Darwinula stevensoni]
MHNHTVGRPEMVFEGELPRAFPSTWLPPAPSWEAGPLRCPSPPTEPVPDVERRPVGCCRGRKRPHSPDGLGLERCTKQVITEDRVRKELGDLSLDEREKRVFAVAGLKELLERMKEEPVLPRPLLDAMTKPNESLAVVLWKPPSQTSVVDLIRERRVLHDSPDVTCAVQKKIEVEVEVGDEEEEELKNDQETICVGDIETEDDGSMDCS